MRIFMGATRMLSFKSTPKTVSGFFGWESLTQGMRLKNLELVRGSEWLERGS